MYTFSFPILIETSQKCINRGGPGTLSKQKEGIRERDRLINEIDDLSKKLQSQTKHLDELEEKHAEDEEKIKDLYRQLEEISNDAFKVKRNLEHAQINLEEVTEEKNGLIEELKTYKQQVPFILFDLSS